MQIPLLGLLPEEITERLSLTPAFRGRQIFSHIHGGRTEFSAMSDLPEGLRKYLEENSQIFVTELKEVHEDEDGTRKLLIGLSDGKAVESVLLLDPNGRKTACLSTQAGCGMACAFCRTGLMGLKRNLEAHEIVEEFMRLEQAFGEVENIVFMGMGEPLNNPENVKKAISILHHPQGRSLGMRRFTISTSGIVPEIERLPEFSREVRLAVSLISADPGVRGSLMPVQRLFGFNELRKAIAAYQELTGNRVTLEYVLLSGVNDRDEDVSLLSRYIKGLSVMVNLIPWNPVPELSLRAPSQQEAAKFLKKLERAGIPATMRVRKGRGVLGACGQLAVFE